jgi:hypothetical protein
MPIASFRDMCVDAVDAPVVTKFWAQVLDQRIWDKATMLLAPDGGPASRRVWINDVSDAKTVKNRVHVDVRMPTEDPQALVDLGATVVREPTEDDKWWVMTDPEGAEFCAFPPASFHHPDKFEVYELVVDAGDALAQATWWSRVLGGTVGQREGAAFAWIEGAREFPWRYWVFTPVPEVKTVKNRWHWDVDLPPGSDPSVLVKAGATVLRERDDEIGWTIMADPEGNEFCAFIAD